MSVYSILPQVCNPEAALEQQFNAMLRRVAVRGWCPHSGYIRATANSLKRAPYRQSVLCAYKIYSPALSRPATN